MEEPAAPIYSTISHSKQGSLDERLIGQVFPCLSSPRPDTSAALLLCRRCAGLEQCRATGKAFRGCALSAAPSRRRKVSPWQGHAGPDPVTSGQLVIQLLGLDPAMEISLGQWLHYQAQKLSASWGPGAEHGHVSHLGIQSWAETSAWTADPAPGIGARAQTRPRSGFQTSRGCLLLGMGRTGPARQPERTLLHVAPLPPKPGSADGKHGGAVCSSPAGKQLCRWVWARVARTCQSTSLHHWRERPAPLPPGHSQGMVQWLLRVHMSWGASPTPLVMKALASTSEPGAKSSPAHQKLIHPPGGSTRLSKMTEDAANPLP